MKPDRSGSIQDAILHDETHEGPDGAFRSASRRHFVGLAAILLAGTGLYSAGTRAAKVAVRIAPPAVDLVDVGAGVAASRGHQAAVFAGGCFWGVQAVYQHTEGVTKAVSVYAGGKAETADYEKVSTGDTGHAQSVKVTFDPAQITYGQLLHIFFSVAHDPTQLNRQGYDVGTQYRSALFYADDAQKQVAEKYIAQLDAARVFPERIVTQLTPLNGLYQAEVEHQDYVFKNPESGYVIAVDLPMLANLKTIFPDHYRSEPKLVDSKSVRLGK